MVIKILFSIFICHVSILIFLKSYVRQFKPKNKIKLNPKTHGELLPTAPRTQVHPQHHDPKLMSTVTTQNLRSTTTKTQIATYKSRSSKPRPKSVMLLLHKSKPKPIDGFIGDRSKMLEVGMASESGVELRQNGIRV